MKKGLLLILAVILTLGVNAQIFSDDFQDGDASDWTTVTPTWTASVPYSWHLSSYSGDYYFSASAYDGTNNLASEQWVISPAFSTTGYTGVTITFDNRQRYTIYQDLELYVSTDFTGDSASFSSATWTQITGLTLDTDPTDYNWATTTDLSLGVDDQATVYIAFKFVSVDGTAGNWTFNNVVVNGTGSSNIETVSNNAGIFPNPAINELNVTSQNNIRSISVSNVIGQRIMNIESVNSKNYSLEVSGLTKGVYLISIENVDGTSSITKFVKK
ncbi:MAG: choice-of-anchor J domain-containing protein [Bacteroidales bacterium]|nr:choice-of-anchor J domain-containing protein [Bacteroidales bacterium]